jgi:lipopolysaccharide exporter
LKKNKTSFIKDSATLALAPFITQVLGFLLIPVITRYYSPKMFGVAALFIVVSSFFGELSNLSLSSALLLPKDEKTVNVVFLLNITMSVLVTIISIVFISLPFANNLLRNYLHEELTGYLWLIPIFTLLQGLYLTLRYLNTRYKKFNRLTGSSVISYLGENSYLLIIGIKGEASGINILISLFISSIIKVGILVSFIKSKFLIGLKETFSSQELIKGLIKYQKFPKYLLPSNIVSRLTNDIPVMLLSVFFAPQIVGFYALANRVLRMPTTLIGNSIGEVYFQRATTYNKTELKEKTILLFDKLLIIGLMPLAILVILGEEIFYIFLGEGWSESGLFAQIMGLTIFVRFLMNPAMYLMVILEKQNIQLYMNIITVLVVIFAFSIGGFLNNVYISLAIMAILNSLVILFIGLKLFKQIGITSQEIIKQIKKTSPIVLLFSFLLVVGKYFLVDNKILLISGLCLCLLYYFIQFRQDAHIKQVLAKYIKRL